MHRSRGFSLIEVVIALGVLATGVLALSGLVLSTQRAVTASQQLGVAQLAARARLEELRSLAWTSDAGAVPVSDWYTNLSVTPLSSSGGVGIGASSVDTLSANVSGFCDFLDAAGKWVGGGTSPPPGTAWVRRWMVRPLDTMPDLLSIQVAVVPVQRSAGPGGLAAARGANGAWLTLIRARRSR